MSHREQGIIFGIASQAHVSIQFEDAGRVQQQKTYVFSGWIGSGLKSGNVLTNEGVKDA